MIEPMHQAVRAEVARSPGVLLDVIDWSTLAFGNHPSKTDRVELTHDADVGYDLSTALIVRGDDGSTIAPVMISLTNADGVLSTRDDIPPVDLPHIDQTLGIMQHVRDLGLDAPLVHVIDREADSVSHWRGWGGDGHLALVRAKDRVVLHDDRATTLTAIADTFADRGDFRGAGPARYHGRPAHLFVAEADVVLFRPGKRRVGKKQIEVPGPPLPLRLIVTEVRDDDGKVLARWLLLTNVPADLADAATIAKWYYFRWKIEDFHKLMKSSGWQLEGWLQRDGERILIKLLLAVGACTAVWALQRRTDAESESFKQILMTLSGRQTKRRRPVTTTGLLAGLWVLQSSLEALDIHGPDKLNSLMESHLPAFATKKRISRRL
jgi:hypothetical protein